MGTSPLCCITSMLSIQLSAKTLPIHWNRPLLVTDGDKNSILSRLTAEEGISVCSFPLALLTPPLIQLADSFPVSTRLICPLDSCFYRISCVSPAVILTMRVMASHGTRLFRVFLFEILDTSKNLHPRIRKLKGSERSGAYGH